MGDFVSYKFKDGIAVVTIDNPPMNVLSKQVQKELKEMIDKLESDNEVVCVVLTTSGKKVFIAGADIKEFPNMINNHKINNICIIIIKDMSSFDYMLNTYIILFIVLILH